MQNPSIKYLRTDQGVFYVFYTENDLLYYYEHKPQHSVPFQVVASDIVGVFSLAHYHNTTYVTYYKDDGNLYVATTTNMTEWKHSLCLLQPKYFGQGKITLIPTDTTCYMLYHTPTETSGIDALFYTEYHDGVWQEGIFFDRFIANQTLPYLCHRVGETHIILYYRTSKTAWGSRELLIQQKNRGTALPLLQGNAPCSDISILTTQDKIHILYSLRTMFRTQIIYQYKQQNTMSPPRILWEGNQCNLCLLFLEGERLTLLWQMNGVNLQCISEDSGWSFGSVHRFSEVFPTRCEKGEFIYGTQSILHAKELFIDMHKGYIPFLPSQYLREHTPQIKALKPPEQRDSLATSQVDSYRNFGQNDFKYNQKSNNDHTPEPITPRSMQHQSDFFGQTQFKNMNQNHNQGKTSEQQTTQTDHKFSGELSEQKKEIENLKRLLMQRNEELSTMNVKWKEKVDSLERKLNEEKEKENHTISPTETNEYL